MPIKRLIASISLLPLLACVALSARAEVRLPKLISDHGVLQRDAPIHIWGWADPGENIHVTFHQQHLATTASDLGKWSVNLSPEKAGGPFDLQVAGTNTVTVSDLLVGDVWFASGQSNMELPLLGFPGSAVLKNGPQEIAAANHPNLRLLHIPNKASMYPLDDEPATWTVCTPDTAKTFSAVAYFFGREIAEKEHVPVGLIDSTWGGTPAEAWVSMDGLAADASLMPVFATWAHIADSQQDVPAMYANEHREDEAAKQAGKPLPIHPWHPNLDSWAPGGLFNAMIAPATPMTIKGVIWYQGETNSGLSRAQQYYRIFPTLITDWRREWREGTFPFLFVQISSFTSTPYEDWGMIRDAQRRTLDVTNTAMAVSIDVGEPDNVHPADKQTVAARLALGARALAYGEKVEYSGPLFRQAVVEGDSMRIFFDHTDGGLTLKSADGFELAGDDHHFIPATAKVEHDTVIVTSTQVLHPKYVRYAWQNAPPATLFNKADLPASTFTSEDPVPAPEMPHAAGK
jgi:sialate O-acetylesterase